MNVDTSGPMSVDARVLKPPTLEYAGKQTVVSDLPSDPCSLHPIRLPKMEVGICWSGSLRHK